MSELDHLVKGFQLADTLPTNCEMTSVDLLLGNDYYLDIFTSLKIEVLWGFYLLSSKLGWIIAGRVLSEDNEINVQNMFILKHGTNATKTDVFQSVESAWKAEVDLQDFWRMEIMWIASI